MLVLPAFTQQPRAGELKLEPFTLVTYDGKPHAAELGRIWVPENRHKVASRLIQIAFVRLKSTAERPAAPIVFLAGGPGVPGIGMARVPVYYALFDKLRQVADVILLDQRGSGMSSPNLSDCPTDGRFPIDAFASEQKFAHALAHAAGNCSWYWRSKGTDVTAYNTEESADDIDDLRVALGATQISLIGHSYGTELGLAVIRRHGDSVQRSVLASVQPPGTHGSLPSVLDLQLEKIGHLAANDATMGKETPDLVSLFKQDVDRLNKRPVVLKITKQSTKATINLTVGGVALQFMAERMLPNGRAVGSLPAFLKSVSTGDYSLLQKRVGDLYNDFDAGITLMGRTTDCSAGTFPERALRASDEARTSLFGSISEIDMQPDVCKAAVENFTLGTEYFAPLYSTVPTLFLSGTLDSNTPPMNAELMRWGFPNSTHIVVENGFHETLPDDSVQAVVVDFFKGQDVSERHVKFEPPHFLSLEEAKQSGRPRH